MCGIAGIYNFELDPDSQGRIINQMLNYMSHRGPDDSGIEIFDKCIIGQKRLSIIDLSANARQPLTSYNRDVSVVVNGEIYNYKDLRQELLDRGHQFKSDSDSEVVLHGFREWGSAIFSKLRGMFAVGIYDHKQRQLILARDRLGIKPLYYSECSNTTIFSSEIGSLLASDLLDRKINHSALTAYLFLGYASGNVNLVDGIKSVPPGSILTVTDTGIQAQTFWNFPLECTSNSFDPRETVRTTREILERSIRLHSQSDVPFGVFLSGGIDSTVITGLLAQQVSNVRTLSVGFEDGSDKLNELNLAKKTAKYFGTNHTEFILNGYEVEKRIPRMIRHIDSPSFDGINTYIVSEMAKASGLTVAFSGLGGDELFGGYQMYDFFPKYASLLNVWNKLPNAIKQWSIKILSNLAGSSDRRNKTQRLIDVTNEVELYASIRADSWAKDIRNMLSKDNPEDNINTRELSRLFNHDQPSVNKWKYLQRLEIRNYVGWRLLRDADSMSMAHSLEVRVPLLDDELVSHVLSLSSGWERSLGWPKKLLVEATKDVIPNHVLKKGKQGFQLPMDIWMKNELKSIVDDVFSHQVIKKRGLFNAIEMTKMLNNFYQEKTTYQEIWKYVVLELWMRQHRISI